MSEDPARQLAITVANAVNAMATMAAAQEAHDPVEYFFANLDGVVTAVITEQAARLVAANFPATEVYTPGSIVANPAAPAAYVPPAAAAYTPPAAVAPVAPVAYVPAPAAPAAIPGVADGDPEAGANWQQFFAAVQAGQLQRDFKSARDGQWFDNRAGKKPNWPDFKVKAPQGQSAPAVWISDKKNPSWVATELAKFGL